MSNALRVLFKGGRWNKINSCAFQTVKNHNPETLTFQHIPVTEKINDLYKKNGLEKNDEMRNGKKKKI